MNRPVALFLANALLDEVQGSEFALTLDRWIVDTLAENEANEQEHHAPRHLSEQPA